MHAAKGTKTHILVDKEDRRVGLVYITACGRDSSGSNLADPENATCGACWRVHQRTGHALPLPAK